MTRAKVLDHVDNTLRVAEGCHGAWAVGNSQVTFYVRTGRRARRAVRRGFPHALDLPFSAWLGFFPEEMLATPSNSSQGSSLWLQEVFHELMEPSAPIFLQDDTAAAAECLLAVVPGAACFNLGPKLSNLRT